MDDAPATKKCPYCAEDIRAEAIKCRYCGSDLRQPVTPIPAAAPKPTRKKKSSTDWVLIGQVLAIALTAFGCGWFIAEAARMLSSRSPSPRPAVAAVTTTAAPSQTLTLTPTASETPTPDWSPTPSYTPTITYTPSITPTPTITLTPSRTPTPTLTPDPRLEYEAIDVRDLAINPESFRGRKIRLRGQVFSISVEGSVTALQMWVSYPGSSTFDREAVVVAYDGVLSGVYEDTYIDVYGVGAGAISGTNAFGATIEQPLIRADIIEVP